MKLALGLSFGGMTQVRPPPGMAAGQTVAVTPTFIDGIAAGSTWVPDGAIAAADFVNGRYYANGAETTFMAMFEENLDWAAWPTPDVQPGIGMVAGNRPALTAAASTGLLAGATVVMTAIKDDPEDVNYGVGMEMFNAPDYDVEYAGALGFTGASAKDLAGSGTAEISDSLTSGVHRCAFTVPALAVALDGSAVDTDTPLITDGYTTIALTVGTNTILRALTLYAPQLDADLPALSALTVDDWLPEGAAIWSDLTTGTSVNDGASVALETLLVVDDPASLTSDGLIDAPDLSRGSSATLTGDALAALLAGDALVLRFTRQSADTDPYIDLEIHDAEFTVFAQLFIGFESGAAAYKAYVTDGVSVAGAAVAVGTHTVAVIMSPTGLAGSLDGGALFQFSASLAGMTEAELTVAGTGDPELSATTTPFLLGFAIVPGAVAADLPALSA